MVQLSQEQTLKEKQQHVTLGFPCAFYLSEGNDTNFLVKHHWHEELEIIHFKKGCYHVEIDMQKYPVEAECFCFVNFGELHSIYTVTPYKESALVWNPLVVNLDSFEEADNQLFQLLIKHDLTLPRFIADNHPLFPSIKAEYSAIEREYIDDFNAITLPIHYKSEHVQSKLMVKACLLKILALFARENLLGMKTQNPNVHIEIIKSVLAYMKKNYDKPIYIHDLAAIANMNEQYFCRFFKNSIGKPPMKYLNELRIRHATALLTDTKLPIMEICLDCGFNNLGNFLREFKSNTGTTPLKYRNASK